MLLHSLIAVFAVTGSVHADTETSALKLAFQKSRAEKNIDIVLPIFLKSRLHIVTGGQAGTNDYFLVPSRNTERFCVTVTESIENLKGIAWPKIEVTGEQLIKELPPSIEIVVVYKNGGDYITREQLQWYRSLIE